MKISNFEKFNENVLNLSKIRKFPTNFYDIYDLSKRELGNFLNTWFSGEIQFFSELKSNKVKAKDPNFIDFLLRDEMWIVKKTDKETSSRLYNRNINPISIRILCSMKNPENGLYNMKLQIHSIDDSSFGIWFDEKELSVLKSIREKLMKTINNYDEINGDELLNHCIELGANKDSIDYN